MPPNKIFPTRGQQCMWHCFDSTFVSEILWSSFWHHSNLILMLSQVVQPMAAQLTNEAYKWKLRSHWLKCFTTALDHRRYTDLRLHYRTACQHLVCVPDGCTVDIFFSTWHPDGLVSLETPYQYNFDFNRHFRSIIIGPRKWVWKHVAREISTWNLILNYANTCNKDNSNDNKNKLLEPGTVQSTFTTAYLLHNINNNWPITAVQYCK